MIESSLSASVGVFQIGGVSYAGFIPPVAFQSFPGGGFMDLMCSKALNFPSIEGRSDAEMGLRLSRDFVTGGAGSATVAADLGLDPVLGFPFGLKVAACGLGRNSLLFGFNLPPCALATPLDRREKLGST